MKKFFSNVFLYIIFALCIILILIANFFQLKSLLENIGGGSWLRGLLLSPFVVSGFYFMLKSFITIWESGVEKLDKLWQQSLYTIFLIFSYCSFFFVIVDLY